MRYIATSSERSDVVNGSPIASVVLLDSIPLFRKGFAALVTGASELRWLGESSTIRAALTLCRQRRPDIVVVDSTIDPYGGLCQLLSHNHGVHTVVVLFDENPEGIQQAANALVQGAHGIVPRTAEPNTLLDALHRFHHGPRRADGKPEPSAWAVPGPRQRTGTLSERERDVLHLIANGLENHEIGRTLFVSTETVRTHVKSVLRKLKARNRSHAVALALANGLVKDAPVLPKPRR